MLRLTTPAFLEINLNGSVATNQLSVVSSILDKSVSGLLGTSQQTLTANTTFVPIVNTPTSVSRDIDYVSIVNLDTQINTVNVYYNNGSAGRFQLVQAVLPINATLSYTHARGWQLIDKNGVTIGTIVNSFNARTGDVVLTQNDVTTALSYTNGSIEVGTGVNTASQLSPGSNLTALVSNGTTPSYQAIVNSFNTRTGAITLTSGDVTTALGFTPPSGLANPTQSVDLSIHNGTATTAMRSDAAPALSQSIVPTWTGIHTFSNNLVLTGLTGSIITTNQAKQGFIDLDDSMTNNQQGGFFAWTSGGPYWSNSTNQFTLIATGTGYIQGKKIAWTQPQTITLAPNATTLAAIDNTGTLVGVNEDSLSSYNNHIPLFLILYDGAQQTVAQEHHFYGAPPRVVVWDHEVIGTVFPLESTGGLITRVTTGSGGVITDRELKVVGNDTIYDLMLTTIIPDSGGAAVSWDFYYTNAGGNWIRSRQGADFQMNYSNAGTVTAIPANKYGIYALYVAKQSENTATPTYLAILDNNNYANLGAAQTAVTNQTFAAPTNELVDLQIARLGNIIVQNSGGGYINTVNISKNIIGGANVSGSGVPSTSALTVQTTDTTTNATYYPTFVSTTGGFESLYTNTGGLTFNPSTNTLTTTTFVGALTGTASGNLVSGGALGTPSSGTLTNCTFPTLNQNTTGKSAASDALNSATTIVNVSSATAPTLGQVLTAVDSTHATWQAAAGGNPAITDDTTTNATMYPTWVTATSGSLPQKTSSSKLNWNPGTSTLTSVVFTGAMTLPFGVGTTTPTFEAQTSGIHVHNNTALQSTEIHLTNTGTTTGGNRGFSIVNDAGTSPNQAYIWQWENGPLLFATNNAIHMKLFAGGNLAVGTSPTDDTINKLQVNGSVGIEATQSTVNGATSGSIICSQPFQGANYKRVVIYCNALVGAAAYTFPTAFSYTPQIISQSLTAIASTTTTVATITGTTSTGFIEISGY